MNNNVWKIKLNSFANSKLFWIAVVLFFALSHAYAEPRSPLPPWPEQTLGIWGFDEGLAPFPPSRAAFGADTAQRQESWSGYSLVRDSMSVSPVAIPVKSSLNGSPNFTASQGTVRFWFCPDWSGATFGGTGPGNYARLIELVSLTSKRPEVVFSLYLNPEGTEIYLSGQGSGRPMDYLSAETDWRAGSWRLVMLAYDRYKTVLSIDNIIVATGPCIPELPAWKLDSLGLVLGSDLSAGNCAQGQFDELCTFDHPLEENDATFYWNGLRQEVARGAFEIAGLQSAEPSATQINMMTLAAGDPPLPGNGGTNSGGGSASGPAFGPTYSTNDLWLQITGVTNGIASVNIRGTTPGIFYELLSRENLTNSPWQPEAPLWPGSEGQDWTPATVLVGTRTNQLYLCGRSYADTDGNGMPDWWEMECFGHTGEDAYGDPDGDGWCTLHEYQNGTNPTAFNTPPAPQGLRVVYNSMNNLVNITWQPALGAVTGYVITRNIPETYGVTEISLALGQTSYSETFPIATPNFNYISPTYTVRAVYAQGSSPNGAPASLYDPTLCVQARLVPNEYGTLTLVVFSLPPQVSTLVLKPFYYDELGNSVCGTNIDVPASSLQNGLFVMPHAWTDSVLSAEMGSQFWYVQGKSASGLLGDPYPAGDGGTELFKDGREHLRQNLLFMLRAANTQYPFHAWPSGLSEPFVAGFSDYVYSDYYHAIRADWYGQFMDKYRPFHDNYALRNLVLSQPCVGTDGFLNTGVYENNGKLTLDLEAATNHYVADGNTTNVPAVLSASAGQGLLQLAARSEYSWPEMGIENSGGTLTLEANTRNIYGLPLQSVVLAGPVNNAIQLTSLSAGQSMPERPGYLYPAAALPALVHSGYYFCEPGVDPFPGTDGFSTTNQTTLLIVPAGDEYYNVAGYAKYGLSNGYPDKWAYLGLYFDKAFKANADGTRGTNAGGILSPYGEFCPTEPGKYFLTTKPDGVSTNIGECVVHAIGLQLDSNHDGIMDPSVTGPDATSYEKPFVFWVNNDYDRGHTVDFTDYEQDDLASNDSKADCAFIPGRPTLDGEYRDVNGSRVIPSERDLEDFTRLWICGVTTNLLSALPPDSTVTLSWGDVGNPNTVNPTIDLFQAVESAGGTGYLTNITTARLQTNASICRYVGRLGPGQSIQLNSSQLPNGWAGEHLIWCGVSNGTGGLTLNISRGGTNTLAQAKAYVQLQDIKLMYERWSVGDSGTMVPTSNVYLAVEDLPPYTTIFQYSQSTDPNTSYILHVHGWNMDRWEKDRFGETMFKRLYWQGYQGRFGIFRWPTLARFPAISGEGADLNHFDKSEYQAWKSGQGLQNLLVALSAKYPGQVRLTAHSMGNVVAGEALRTNTALTAIYVAMQGAVPAGAYDLAAPFREIPNSYFDGTTELYRFYPVGTPSRPCFYQVGGAGVYVDFYNPLDWALNLWQTDQNLKPDDTLGYSFDISTGTFYQYQGTSTQRVLNCPTNTYELFAYCVEGQCWALGAQINVGGVFDKTQQLDLNATFGFGGAHKGHSGQFRSTYMAREPFWNALGSTLGVLP